jgi:PPOX class probable F420-dependent enzyme
MHHRAMPRPPILNDAERRFVMEARRAVLATIDPDGRPRLVPVCHVLAGARDVLYSPIDEKPKRSADPRALARVRDILARPEVVVLVDRWDEEWRRLAWVRLAGAAELIEPDHAEHAGAVAALRAKYAQYAAHRLEARPVIRVAVARVASWGALP